MKFNYKEDFNRCKKHDGCRILYTGDICPLCDVNEALERLNKTVTGLLEWNEKLSSLSKTMERLF